ncbi:MAG: hypothetical protein JNK63_04975 [Chthonomonas sp.]|nr:hypothetical protein [Chthonomonas sp.]
MVLNRSLMLLALSQLAVASWATLVYVSDINNDSVLKFEADTGEYKGSIGTGLVPNLLSVEQSPFDDNLYVTCTSGTGFIVRLNPYTGEYLGMIGNGFLEFPDDIAFGPDGTLYVTDLKSTGGCILKFNPTTGEYLGIIGNGFLGSANWGHSIDVNDSNVVYVIGAGGTAIQKFNGLTGEYLGVIGSGFFSNGRGLVLTNIGGEEHVLSGIASSQGSVLKFKTSDSSYQGVLASGGFVPNVRAIDVMPNGWLLARGYSNPTEYVARFVPDTGEYKGLFAANWGISGYGIAVETPATVTGTLVFGNYVGSGVSRPVTFEFYDGATFIDSTTINVTPNGGTPVAYSVDTDARGASITVKANGTRWLKEAVVANISGPGATGVNLTLQNGDPDLTGEVDAADIDMVILNFGSVFPGPGPEDSDIDGSGEVDAADIDVVIANFGAIDD